MALLGRLKEAGLPAAQAEAVLSVVEEMNEAALLRNWMADTFATKVELTEAKVDLIKWMAGLALTTTGLLIGAMYFMLAHFKP